MPGPYRGHFGRSSRLLGSTLRLDHAHEKRVPLGDLFASKPIRFEMALLIAYKHQYGFVCVTQKEAAANLI